MIDRITAFWNEWKNTAVGKAIEDFFWTVLYASVAAGLSAALPIVAGGESDPRIVWGVFSAGVPVAFMKSISVFVDKYKNPNVPNSPSTP